MLQSPVNVYAVCTTVLHSVEVAKEKKSLNFEITYFKKKEHQPVKKGPF